MTYRSATVTRLPGNDVRKSKIAAMKSNIRRAECYTLLEPQPLILPDGSLVAYSHAAERPLRHLVRADHRAQARRAADEIDRMSASSD
jgi:hypothetical protein